jgi:hypothetical protein
MAQDGAATLGDGSRAIPLNPETLQQLNNLVAPAEELKQEGYVLKPLTVDELEQKKRCTTCGVRSEPTPILTNPDCQPGLTRRAVGSKKPLRDQNQRPQHAEAGQQPGVEGSDSPAVRNDKPPNVNGQRPKLICKFHPGKVINKVRPFPIPEHPQQKN